MSQSLLNPLPNFIGLASAPLTAGYVYLGEPNQDPRTYPVDVFWDEALTIAAPQPLRTTAGYISRNGAPANVWTDGACSIMVLDSAGRQVYYVAEITGLDSGLRAALAASSGATLVKHGSRTVAAILDEFDQDATNDVFPQDGAKIQRLNDRVMIGGATDSDLLYPNVVKDWLSTFQTAAGTPSGSLLNAQAGVMTSTSPDSNFGFLAAARSLHFTGAAQACIGAISMAVNNHATLATKAWGHYVEAHRTTAAPVDTFGMEIDTRTLSASITPHPWQLGEVVALQLASGCELASGGQFDASAAIQIAANPMQFKTGINFMHNALDGSTGGVGEAVAIAMAITQNIEWFNSSGVRTAYLRATTTNAANRTGLVFNDSGLFVLGNAGQNLAAIPHVTSAANYVQLQAAAAGSAARVIAAGSDADVDLQLEAKGAGKLRTSYATTAAGTPGSFSAARILAFKDSSGTTYYLPAATATW